MIAGAGRHGRVVADILQRAHDSGSSAYPAGFVDDTPELLGTTIAGLPVLGPIPALGDLEHDTVIVTIGDNAARRRLTEELLDRGEKLAMAIHPFSYVAPSANVGEGTMICAGAVVAVQAVLGRGVILNTRASVDHESVVGDFAHLSAGATAGARVHIGAESLIALGASVVSNMRVGARTVIGAGAVVVADIPDDVVAFGVPARVKSSRRA